MDRYYWNGVHAEPMIYERTPVREGLRDCTTDAAGNRPDAAGYFPADYTRGGNLKPRYYVTFPGKAEEKGMPGVMSGLKRDFRSLAGARRFCARLMENECP